MSQTTSTNSIPLEVTPEEKIYYSPEVDFTTSASRKYANVMLPIVIADAKEEPVFQKWILVPQGVIDMVSKQEKEGWIVTSRKLIDNATCQTQSPLMDSGPWRCQECQQPATKFYRCWITCLDEDPPYIKDPWCRPICDKPECGVRSGRWVQKQVDAAAPNKEVRNQTRKNSMHLYSCKACYKREEEGSDVKLQRCARCKFVYYCSPTCQAKDWSKHKPYCVDVKKKKHQKS